MSDLTPIPSVLATNGLLESQVTELLRANGLDEVVSRSRQLAVLQEITRHRAAVDEGDEASRWRLAQALERLALTVRQADGRRRLFDEAFVCRRALDIGRLSVADRLAHLLCLGADALAADRRAELIMLLRNITWESLEVPETMDWSEELLLRVARAFLIMARRSGGWDDVRAAGEEIARLRELQANREAPMLADAGAEQLSSLVALYNLVPPDARPSLRSFLFQAWREGLYDPRGRGGFGYKQALKAVLGVGARAHA